MDLYWMLYNFYFTNTLSILQVKEMQIGESAYINSTPAGTVLT